MTDFTKIRELFGLKTTNGLPEKEINDIKNLFGTIPEPLIDYYRELGNFDYNYWQDDLIRFNENKKCHFKHFLNDNFMIICHENQGVCYAGIKKSELFYKNPPVYFTLDADQWKIGCDNLIDYIHGFAYIQAAIGLDYNGSFDVSDYGIDFVRKNNKNKNILFKNWLTNGNWEFYGDYNDTIIIIASETSLFYASNNEKHFIEMENKWKRKDIEYK